MKKFLAAILAVSIVFGAGTAVFDSAEHRSMKVYASSEYTEGTYGDLTYRNYGDYIEISGCDESAKSVEIPAEIDGVSVTSIGCYTFGSCEALTDIFVDENNTYYTSVDGVLFNKDKTAVCAYPRGKKDSEYTIPDSVTSIGENAFCSCSSLTSVTIPDSVTSIGEYAFQFCIGIKFVAIPDSVINIGMAAFIGCTALASVTIPYGVESIDACAFEYCSGLTSVIIPESVTSIGNSVFYLCEGLNTVIIPESVTDIGGGAFYGFTGTLYSREGSYVQLYAEEEKLNFVAIGMFGDVDDDGAINSSDASLVLREYALIATGGAPTFTKVQKIVADVNADGVFDSSDASGILAYYAYTATGGTDTLKRFLASK